MRELLMPTNPSLKNTMQDTFENKLIQEVTKGILGKHDSSDIQSVYTVTCATS
jgi:hypothetical protein